MTAYMSRPDRNITYCKLTNKQRVKITRDGVTHELGRFDTKEEAILYCERHGIAYRVLEPQEPARRIAAYADNFAYTRREPWTH